jgi:hypothetical protein
MVDAIDSKSIVERRARSSRARGTSRNFFVSRLTNGFGAGRFVRRLTLAETSSPDAGAWNGCGKSSVCAASEEQLAMTEERITEVHTPTGETHTHTTVITDTPKSGGTATWLIVLLLIVAIGAGIWFFSGIGGAEVAKDNAVAEAADEVGNAAGQVGDAAQDVADSVTN